MDDIQLPRDNPKSFEKIHADHPAKKEECNWGSYARGALYALQRRGNHLKQVRYEFGSV